MSTTPSPSKRPRLPTSSAVPSASASPFPSTSRPNGPRSVGPTGTSALGGSAPIVGLGMSPADAFSPAPEGYGLSGYTPYSTTSPAYTASAGMNAASPISAALAHGSRILSNIQPSPFYNGTPMIPQQPPYGARFPGQQPFGMLPMMHPALGQQQQHQAKPAAPQPGSPEYLRAALQHLQTTLLARLESEAEGFFDAVDSALDVTSDTRTVASKASTFQSALDSVLAYLEKNGLASIPLLPLPDSDLAPSNAPATASSTAAASTSATTAPASAPTTATETTTSAGASDLAPTNTDAAKEEASKPPTDAAQSLDTVITQLQHQAKELFDRRQRLKESASIVSGILDS